MMHQRGLGKKIVGWVGSMLCLLAPVATSAASSSAPQVIKPVAPTGWKEFHATTGNCSMMFPAAPEHISEKMAMPDEGFELKYDAYISAGEQQTVYMLLIAQYPDFVDETYAQMSLEGFLNGILTHNPGNQLLFADLLLVEGNQALDFFIRTGGVYFKGRAVMVKNSMYLMAMECEIPQYDEGRYKHFVDSFKLHAIKTKGN
jgi:hypothetical protein